jgi:Ser/Thr protein kinase RdoA (MazF antagonist)
MTEQRDALSVQLIVAPTGVTAEQAVALVREHYGLAVRLSPLTGERDENFKLTTATGGMYVLKVAAARDSPAATALQTAALLHLATVDPDIPCPRVQKTRDGGVSVRVRDARGAARSAHVLSFLPGRLLCETVASNAQREAVGRLAGRLARALSTFSHPGAQRPLIWDLRNAGVLPGMLEDLPTFPCQSLARTFLAAALPRAVASLEGARQQVVHNDLNARNILLDPTDESRLTGVIDFGDMVYTALIADVAVGCAELMPAQCFEITHAMDCCEAFLRGYQTYMPLLGQELEVLPVLVAVRLFMNVVLNEWYVRNNPRSRHAVAQEPQVMCAQVELALKLLKQGV